VEEEHGLPGASLNKIFSGSRKSVESDTLVRLAEALAVTVEWLWSGKGVPPTATLFCST
jgi:DNA-binding Xre family transcriptional regulator